MAALVNGRKIDVFDLSLSSTSTIIWYPCLSHPEKSDGNDDDDDDGDAHVCVYVYVIPVCYYCFDTLKYFSVDSFKRCIIMIIIVTIATIVL